MNQYTITEVHKIMQARGVGWLHRSTLAGRIKKRCPQYLQRRGGTHRPEILVIDAQHLDAVIDIAKEPPSGKRRAVISRVDFRPLPRQRLPQLHKRHRRPLEVMGTAVYLDALNNVMGVIER